MTAKTNPLENSTFATRKRENDEANVAKRSARRRSLRAGDDADTDFEIVHERPEESVVPMVVAAPKRAKRG